MSFGSVNGDNAVEIILSYLSVILALVIMESLLSVDNAMVLAALASQLPKHQQRKALWYGLLGAYVFRGLALVLAAWLATNYAVKFLGAIYLLYAMCKHINDSEDHQKHTGKSTSFWGTVLIIELTDVVFAIDNVIAAVAISKDFWAVCVGVAIGILSMRLITGYVITLMEKAPILKKTAFLLLGVVGGFMLLELLFHIELSETAKFGLILLVIGSCLLYERSKILRTVFGPPLRAIAALMEIAADIVGYPFSFLAWLVMWPFRRPQPPAQPPAPEGETK